MRRFWAALGEYFRKGDHLLLLFCLLASGFGLVAIASAANYMGTNRQVIVQAAALVIGVLFFVMFSLLDVELLAEHWMLLVAFCYLFILALIPLGNSSHGNRAWMRLPLLPFDVQPAEICKIPFIIAVAKIMSIHQNRISSPRCVGTLALVAGGMLLLILVFTGDAGSALVYIFIFLLMVLISGISGWWYVGGAAGLALAGAGASAVYRKLFGGELWQRLIRPDQLERLMVPFDPSIDPSGKGVRHDALRSIEMLTGGGISGQGLFRGYKTQTGSIFAQHTDFIFSAIGEELGILGCVFTMLLIAAVIARCVHVGLRTGSFMNREICFGIAAMLAFQMLINVGMCLGVMPVIGLTLPFISYGGSSLITVFAAMGVVSGIHMRPDPEAASPYVRPRY